MGFFPVDVQSCAYLKQTGRSKKQVEQIEAYLKAMGMFRTYGADAAADPVYSATLEMDLASVKPSVSGPKRPHDRVAVADMVTDFKSCLSAPVGFKGFGLEADDLDKRAKFTYKGVDYELKHGSVVLAAITSCTNTSNPGGVLLFFLSLHLILPCMENKNSIQKKNRHPNDNGRNHNFGLSNATESDRREGKIVIQARKQKAARKQKVTQEITPPTTTKDNHPNLNIKTNSKCQSPEYGGPMQGRKGRER